MGGLQAARRVSNKYGVRTATVAERGDGSGLDKPKAISTRSTEPTSIRRSIRLIRPFDIILARRNPYFPPHCPHASRKIFASPPPMRTVPQQTSNETRRFLFGAHAPSWDYSGGIQRASRSFGAALCSQDNRNTRKTGAYSRYHVYGDGRPTYTTGKQRHRAA